MHVRLRETGKSQWEPSVFLRHVDKVSVKFILSVLNSLPHIHIQMQNDGRIVRGENLIPNLGSLSVSYNLALWQRILTNNQINGTIIVNQNKYKP